MKSKTILMVIPILCSIMFMFLPSESYGHGGHHHGDGGGGGCNNCTPPTLGVDKSGKRQVSGGISINGQLYDVELFKQELDTQTLTVGEPAEITLKIFDDGGYDTLTHVELGLGYDEKFLTSVWVPYNHVLVEWNKTFDGEISVKYNDPENLLTDISVEVVDNSPVIGIKFKFTPNVVFDSSVIVTKMWDTNRNANTNYFYNVFDIVSNEPVFLLADSEQSTATISFEAEKTQTNESIEHEINYDVKCSADQKRLLRVSNMVPVCVDAYQAEVLISSNWAVPTQ